MRGGPTESLNTQNSRGLPKYVVEHRFRELPRKGILLAWMITSEEGQLLVQPIGDAVAKLGSRPQSGPAQIFHTVKDTVESGFSQSHDYAEVFQEEEFAEHVGAAVPDLPRQQFVLRGCAVAYRGDVGIVKPQPIRAVGGDGLVGEPRPVQGTVEPVSAFVTRENPPSPVSAVCRRSESHDEEPCSEISEGGNRLAPVLLVPISPGFLFRNRFPPSHQPLACSARDKFRLEQ